jgi:peroxiredoxin
VIGSRQGNEGFRIARRVEDPSPVLRPHDPVVGRVKDQQGAAEPAYDPGHVLGAQIIQEFPRDGEGSSRQQHLRRPPRLDLFQRAGQVALDMLGRCGGRDGRYGLADWDVVGSMEDSGTTQRVADQDRWRLPFALQELRSCHEVPNVGGERRVGKLTLALTQTGEVEAEHTDTGLAQGPADIDHRFVLFRAREAVGEQRIGDGLPVRRELQSSGESGAGGAEECQSLCLHLDTSEFPAQESDAASVKLVAWDWIDCLHVAKFDGRWIIVNVLWEKSRGGRSADVELAIPDTGRTVNEGGTGMVLTPSTMLPLGTPAPDFNLTNAVDGKSVALSDFEGKSALLVMFICNHCPYVQHVRGELGRLAADFMPRGLAVVAINSNDVESHAQDSPENMRKLAASEGWQFPFLHDETQEVAKAYKAACTPDFFLFGAERRLVYRGQLDDSRPGNAIPVSGKDLREAVAALLKGEPVPAAQKPSLGCNIKWKPGNEPSYASP